MSSRLINKIIGLIKPPEEKTRLRGLVLLVLMVIAACSGYLLPERLTVSLTDSLPHRVFWLRDAPENPQDIKLGQYLAFKKDHPWRHLIDENLSLKYVACMPGMKLKTTNTGHYYCNKKYLGTAIKKDSTGKILERFEFNDIIQDGKYFLKGTGERSYDSKYYGLVSANEFVYSAQPIF